MANKWYNRLFSRPKSVYPENSWLRTVVTGSLYRISDIRGESGFTSIRSVVDTMRALAEDSQISTALAFYATDATTVNTAGSVIWATSKEGAKKEGAEIINQLFERWNINAYARDHILELATIGNLYIPTTYFFRDISERVDTKRVMLDNNTIPDPDFDIIPSYKIPPESIVHLWSQGRPVGFVMDPDDDMMYSENLLIPEQGCVHFSLGGLLGQYTLDTVDSDGDPETYDIQFATPLMQQAVQPTQTLSLLEDATVLSALSRTIKFINVDAGTEETEIRDNLQQVKDAIEQQLSINTQTGDAQSYVNPQSPNNLIFVPKDNGNDMISITDLNMTEANEADNNLLNYYQDKKLSVLGVPKEAMNFSSNEGLGGAGSVLSQRSALYANSLQRLETAYMAGWKDAIDKYFTAKNLSGFIGTYDLHMNPIITTQSTIQFEKRDAALGQATTLVQMLKDMGVTDKEPYTNSLVEILSEVFPQMGADARSWDIDVEEGQESGGPDAF